MQPLCYQSGETTCWVACMVNGIRFVLEQDRIPTAVYRLLHSVLRNAGVRYDAESGRAALDNLLEWLNVHTDLFFAVHVGDEVAETINNLQYNWQSVAVCDIGNGDHSILLNQRRGEWFSAFDPWWYGPPGSRRRNANLRFPADDRFVNVKIRQSHLVDENLDENKYNIGRAYQMGEIGSRFVIVVERG